MLMNKLFQFSWKWALLVVCFLVCSIFSVLPQLLLPNEKLGITSLSAEPSSWQLYIGEADIHSLASGSSEAAGWGPLEQQLRLMDINHYSGTYWLQRKLPSAASTPSYLWIKQSNDFKLYLNQTLHYAYEKNEKTESSSSLTLFFNLHIIPLTSDFQDQTLIIRSSTDGKKPILDTVLIGSGIQLYQSMLISDAVKLILAAWFVILGSVSASLYILNHKRNVYFYFSLFSFTVAFAGFIRCYLPHTLINLSWYTALKDITLPICMLAIVGFQEALGGSRKLLLLLRRVRCIMLVFTLLCLIAALTYSSLYALLMTKALPVMYILLSFLGIREIWRYGRFHAQDRSKEAEILIFGFNIVGSFTLMHVMVTLNSPVSTVAKSLFPLLEAYWGYNQIFVGCFVFDLCLGLILLFRFTETYKQVKAYASELESQNQKQQTISHLHYQMSIQETFAAMGEVAIWEERNRIAHEIHDILGHKLTATLVQLEAAKRLITVSPELALQKLEFAQEAVRQGLHDIREAVHTVKNNLKRADLHTSLLELIHETEKMSGITIEFDIGSLPAMNALQKKVLYHALQEGLTNGIKHGGSKQFVFQLYHEANQLHFLLINYGIPYSYHPPGYGLTAMTDKVRHLGGRTSLRALNDQGSVLQITIPLSFSLYISP